MGEEENNSYNSNWFMTLSTEIGQNLQYPILELITVSILTIAEDLVSPTQGGLEHFPSWPREEQEKLKKGWE